MTTVAEKKPEKKEIWILAVHLPVELRRKFKSHCALHDLRMSQVALELIESYLAKQK